MTRSGERDLSRIGGLDYALMTLGSCLAAFSGAMALQQVAVGLFAITVIVIGATVSYAARVALLRSPFVKLDGFLYAMAVIAGFAFAPQIQQLMPDGGYPADVIAAGWLTCMLMLGSFFTWQDATILFQAVPSISMFALAGIYSTWDGVNFAFFGFLICLATLVARAHRRAMLVQAAESGYFTRGLAPGSLAPSVETTPGLARRMQDGPWKWIAGPEWALVSALAIILVSLLGAPVIKMAVKPVSGFAAISIPRSIAAKLHAMSSTASDTQTTVSVGQGPDKLEPTPQFDIRTDSADAPWIEYVRVAAFYSFAGHTWSTMRPPEDISNTQSGTATGQSIVAIAQENRHEFPFQVRLRKPLADLPTPGFVTTWDGRPPISKWQYDGRIEVPPTAVGQIIAGRAVAPKTGTPKASRSSDLAPIFDEARGYPSIPDRVVSLVNSTIGDAKTDFEKARRIRDKIASTITYNINAPAIPPDTDPVDYVMFNHREAYCDVYATAMTIMARVARIPARFVKGYRTDPANTDQQGWTVALESDLHAWSELYFQDYGWVIFDATDGSASVPDAGRGASNNQGPLWTRPWFTWAINFLICAGLAAGLFLGVRSLLGGRTRQTPRLEIDRAYVRFTSLIERKLGVRRNLSATPDEFLATAQAGLGGAYPLAAELNERFVALFYTPQATTPEDVETIRNRLGELSKLLKEKR